MKFDRIARAYGLIERLTTGSRMQRGRVAHLGAVRDAKRVLIAGEGNGRFLAACVRELPEAKFTVIDESPKMLHLAQKRWLAFGGMEERATFVCADLLSWKPLHLGYDLIVTHFFLDCFTADLLPQVCEKLTSAATADASWLLADFCTPSAGLARWRAKLILRAAYAIFRVMSGVPAKELTPPDQIIEKMGFVLLHRSLFDWEMIHSDLWSRSTARGLNRQGDV